MFIKKKKKQQILFKEMYRYMGQMHSCTRYFRNVIDYKYTRLKSIKLDYMHMVTCEWR